jgi:hypothetical protein
MTPVSEMTMAEVLMYHPLFMAALLSRMPKYLPVVRRQDEATSPPASRINLDPTRHKVKRHFVFFVGYDGLKLFGMIARWEARIASWGVLN